MPPTAQTPSPAQLSIYWRLDPPVVVVTVGRGREVFRDSRALFGRLAEIPTLGDRVAAIWSGNHYVAEPGTDALMAMLETVGFRPFFRLCSTRTGPERALRTRWCWQYLSEYLAWNWRRQ